MTIPSSDVEDRETPRLEGISRALSSVRRIVGEDRVEIPQPGGGERTGTLPGTNVGMYRPRRVHGVVRPETVEQVRQLVKVLDDSTIDCGFHAISTGRNWGLGSREPARDDVLTLDLGGLDRMRALDLDEGWAVVEPGVTQGRLAERLAGTDRMLNVTASSAHTSILGNGLDRGVGLRRQRVDDLAGLEVVLPDGRLVHVGWWPEENRVTPVYQHGLGPSLVSLFLQSDLGVVTAAAVRLLPRPEAQRIVRLSFGQDALVPAIDEMRRWVGQGLVGGVLKVYDMVSADFYGGRVGEFLAHVSVDGTEKSVEADVGVIEAEAAACGLFSQVDGTGRRDAGSGSEDDVVVRMVQSAYAGDPSSNDAMLSATLGSPAEDVDVHGLGWLFFLPMIPFSGESVAAAYGLLAKIHEETGVRAGSTINALGNDLIDFVVTIKFTRDEEGTGRAHSALERAYELFADAGFIPYRLDVDHAEWVDRLAPDKGARDLVRQLKSWIDPNRAIAPGRYA